MDEHIDKLALMAQAKKSLTHESHKCMAKEQDYRIFVGARDTYPEDRQYFIDVTVNLYLKHYEMDLEMMERGLALLGVLKERGYFITRYDNGTISCEIEADTYTLIPLYNEISSAMKAKDEQLGAKPRGILVTA